MPEGRTDAAPAQPSGWASVGHTLRAGPAGWGPLFEDGPTHIPPRGPALGGGLVPFTTGGGAERYAGTGNTTHLLGAGLVLGPCRHDAV